MDYSFLTRLNFTEYEARAYCALLRKAPANGYKIAVESGVPRSKVYEVLNSLVANGAAVLVSSDSKGSQYYSPTDPEALIASIEKQSRLDCAHAREELDRLGAGAGATEVFWRVESQADLIGRARELIQESTSCLHVALWTEEFGVVVEDLKAALGRGVKMALILYTDHPALPELQAAGAGAVLHGASKMQSVPVLGRQFALVCDRERCVTGTVMDDGVVQGAYTVNRGLVTNVLDMVNHEIYLERILQVVPKPIRAAFGENLEYLDAFDVSRVATAAD